MKPNKAAEEAEEIPKYARQCIDIIDLEASPMESRPLVLDETASDTDRERHFDKEGKGSSKT
jgi:hypothetical protein